MTTFFTKDPTEIPCDGLQSLDRANLRIDDGNGIVRRFLLSVTRFEDSKGSCYVRALRLGGGPFVVKGGMNTLEGADLEYFYLTETAVRTIERGVRGADLLLRVPQ